MTKPVPAAPYREAVTENSTPVAVTTYRLVQDLYESNRGDDDRASVSFTELRALALAAQKVMLEDVERRTKPGIVIGFPSDLSDDLGEIFQDSWRQVMRQGRSDKIAPLGYRPEEAPQV